MCVGLWWPKPETWVKGVCISESVESGEVMSHMRTHGIPVWTTLANREVVEGHQTGVGFPMRSWRQG